MHRLQQLYCLYDQFRIRAFEKCHRLILDVWKTHLKTYQNCSCHWTESCSLFSLTNERRIAKTDTNRMICITFQMWHFERTIEFPKAEFISISIYMFIYEFIQHEIKLHGKMSPRISPIFRLNVYFLGLFLYFFLIDTHFILFSIHKIIRLLCLRSIHTLYE